jgi:hypothetical protein
VAENGTKKPLGCYIKTDAGLNEGKKLPSILSLDVLKKQLVGQVMSHAACAKTCQQSISIFKNCYSLLFWLQ